MINEKLAKEYASALAASCHLEPERIRFELMDDWEFLLVTLAFTSDEVDERIVQCLRRAQEIAEAMLPWRVKNNSWMVNATREGEVVNSVFGGDILSPRSGYIDL